MTSGQVESIDKFPQSYTQDDTGSDLRVALMSLPNCLPLRSPYADHTPRTAHLVTPPGQRGNGWWWFCLSLGDLQSLRSRGTSRNRVMVRHWRTRVKRVCQHR